MNLVAAFNGVSGKTRRVDTSSWALAATCAFVFSTFAGAQAPGMPGGGAMAPRGPAPMTPPPSAPRAPTFSPPPVIPQAPTTTGGPALKPSDRSTTTAGGRPSVGPPPINSIQDFHRASTNGRFLPVRDVVIVVSGKHERSQGQRTQTDAGGMFTLDNLTAGVHYIEIRLQDLIITSLKETIGGKSDVSPSGNAVLIGLLLPAVQKTREAATPSGFSKVPNEQSVFVQRAFPLSTKDVRIAVTVPDDGGSIRVNWGDGGHVSNVATDGNLIEGAGALNGMRARGSVGVVPLDSVSAASLNFTKIEYSATRVPETPVASLGVTGATRNGKAIKLSTDRDGIFRLGSLGPGTHDLELEGNALRSIFIKYKESRSAEGSGASAILVGLLLPAVQKLQEGGAKTQRVAGCCWAVRAFPADGSPIRLTLSIPENGSEPTVAWGTGVFVAAADVNGDGRGARGLEDIFIKLAGVDGGAVGRVTLITTTEPASGNR